MEEPPVQSEPTEARSRKRRGNQWAILGAIAGVVAAVAAVLALTSSSGSAPMQNQGSGNTGCQVDGSNNVIICPGSAGSQDQEAQIRTDAARGGEQPPQGPGPWLYVTLGTRGIGLKVRTTNTATGTQVGGLAPGHLAYAVCKSDSGFDPEPGSGLGTTWLKIRWPADAAGGGFYESQPGLTTTAWAYGGYLVPVHHNGGIPMCPPGSP
jgi:hypothetical protein